jgi:hypothetical protein
LAHELGEDERALGQEAAAFSFFLVQERGVPEDHTPLPRGGAVVVHERERQPREALGQLLRVGNRRARHDEARIPAVQSRHPPQASQDRRHVRPEDASQDVRLVDRHELEVAQEVAPGIVVRQDTDVQHIRVG